MLKYLVTILLFISCRGFAQNKINPVAKFSFNHGLAKDDVSGIMAKTVGVTPAEDRFGNPSSAFYFHGTMGSYMNLGTYAALKQRQATISLWFKMDNQVYSGKGYNANPIIVTKTHLGNDFNEAYCISYELYGERITASSYHVESSDTLHANIRSINAIKPGEWYHVVMFYNDSIIGMYLNGELQNKVIKNFPTTFLAQDSVILGYSASPKNVRFFNGTIDDVEIYNRVLSPEEIKALYDRGDPNRNTYIIKWLIAVLLCISAAVFIMLRLLKEEKAKNKRQKLMYEMEMQVIRAQMNPHFIFNAINSIHHFILEADNENASKYLVKFSRLLRTILESNREEYITLENEIDILMKYIEIEALRFEASFKYEIITDAGMNSAFIKIPQMLIQPFVENAIWHGLLPKKADRALIISFKYINPKLLLCTIDDNGKGRKEKITNKGSLAITFIRQRLELLSKQLGGHYEVQIIDKVDENRISTGTTVIVKLPILN